MHSIILMKCGQHGQITSLSETGNKIWMCFWCSLSCWFLLWCVK